MFTFSKSKVSFSTFCNKYTESVHLCISVQTFPSVIFNCDLTLIMNFQFIESTRGGKVLLESGFQYCLKRTNKSSQVWRCRYRPKCSGSITVSSDDS